MFQGPSRTFSTNFFLALVQFQLPAVSRLASRGEEWLKSYVIYIYIYTNRSQARLDKKVKKLNLSMQNRFNSIKFTIMYIANKRSLVLQEIFLLSRVKQYNHFLNKRGHPSKVFSLQ